MPASAPASPPAAEPRQTRARLVRGQPAAAAFRELLELCAGDFERHREAMMDSAAPEGPHGARVALRRLRTALLAFAPLLRRRPARRLAREARALFRLLGRLRDADVLAGSAASMSEGPARAAEAARIRAEVRAALAGADASGFAARVAAWARDEGWRRRGAKKAARGPVEPVAAAALDDAWARQHAHGKRLDRMAVEARHVFRKDLKALRYQGDFFAALWPGRAQEVFLQRIKCLQDDLGLLNDLALAEAQRGSASTGAEADAASAALATAAADWRRLRRTRPWWRRG